MRMLSACLLLGVLIGCSRGGVEISLKTEAPVTDVYVIVGPEKEFLAALAPGAAKSLRMKPVEGQELTVTYKVGERQQSAAGPVLDAGTVRVDVRLEAGGEKPIVFQPVRR